MIDSNEFNNAEIMKDEIFGPFLTIVTFNNNNSNIWKYDAVKLIRSQGEPLVCYVYSKNKSFIEYFHTHVQCGAVIGNDCIMQLLMTNVPFGGVGQSGMGSYSGKYSFNTFTHMKPIVIANHGNEWINELFQRYPPSDLKRLTKVFKLTYLDSIHTITRTAIKYFIIGLIVACLVYVIYFVLHKYVHFSFNRL